MHSSHSHSTDMAAGMATRVLGTFVVLCTALAVLMRLFDLNATVFLWLNHVSARYLPDAVPSVITMFGTALWAFALLAPCLLLTPRVSLAGLYATPVAVLLTHVPKNLFPAPRPGAVLDEAAHFLNAPMGWGSFPSGHSITALTAATVLILGCERVRRSAVAVSGVLLLAITVPLSRIAVGAHWPVDVLMGSALGVVAGWTGMQLLLHFPASDSFKGIRLAATIHLTCAVVLFLSVPVYPQEKPLRAMLAVCSGMFALLALVKSARSTAETAVAEPSST